ncbi:MAG: hypothetical protein HY840_01245 [Bacteroidetes bacterium]|nr:hypothetical protein [Bacteroidota bacterium]
MHTTLLYIDPGTGSLIAQVILAGAAAFFMFFKNAFKSFFNRFKSDSKKTDNEQNSN